MSLTIGESFLVNGADGKDQLCIVQKIDGGDKRNVVYKLHTDAREAKDRKKENLSFSQDKMRQHGARKVSVDSLGTIRRSGD